MSAAVMFRSALRPAVQAAGRRTAAATVHVCRQAPRMMSTYFTPGEAGKRMFWLSLPLCLSRVFVSNGISL